MKKICFSVFVISIATFTACNNSNTKNEQEGHDMNNMTKDTTKHSTDTAGKEVKIVAVTYPLVDVKAAAAVKEIVDHYLQIKNALANDQGMEAATGAKAMEAAIFKLDKSLLTAEQKTAYDKIEDVLKENAAQIAKNIDNIKQQRSLFVMLSEGTYALVSDFGAGRPIYHDHCPMARDYQGAMWISEIKPIKNPYFGAEMPACGTVEEVIQ